MAGNDSMVSPPGAMAGTEVQLLLLQLLTQLKPLPHLTPNSSNGSFGEEENLMALVNDPEAQEQETKLHLERPKRSSGRAKRYTDMQILPSWKEGSDRLLKATKTGNVTDMTTILDSTFSKYIDLEYEYAGGWTVLEWAVALGHAEACRLLLERGANPQRVTYNYAFYIDDDETVKHWPLRLAARFGHLEISSLLIQYGAEIPNDEPEIMAMKRGYLKLAQLLCEWKKKENCVYLVETSQ